MSIYERMESLRKSKNLSMGKIEKELGFSNGSWSKGKNNTPSPDRLQKIADYFGVSMEYLLNGDEEKEYHSIPDELLEIMEKAKNLNATGIMELSNYLDYMLTKAEFKKEERLAI
jgi:transcriptional regulator with XRE-family HTH domain